MIEINTQLLNRITEEARSNERLRMNCNLHKHAESKTQRLLNALEPGTLVPIHRHPETDETYVLLRGKLKVFFHEEDRSLNKVFILDNTIGNYGIHIPAGQWHSLEVLEENTVIFEVKDGPYVPITPQNML